MKKTISILLIILTILTVLSSCNNSANTNIIDDGNNGDALSYTEDNELPTEFVEKDEYNLILGTEESKHWFSGVNAVAALSAALKEVEDKGSKQTIECSVMGKNLVAEYSVTQDDGLYNGYQRVYKASLYTNDDILVRYTLDNEPKSWAVFYKESTRPNNTDGKELSYDECYEIALEQLKKTVETHTDYVLVRGKETADIYHFSFVRMNGKLKTMESIAIHVDEYGNVVTVGKSHYNEMKDIPTVPDAVVSKALKTVLADINQRYQAVKDKFSILKASEDDASLRLVRLKDGTVALDVTLDVLVGKNGTDESATETHRYIVPLE